MTNKVNWAFHELKISVTFSGFYRLLDLNRVYSFFQGHQEKEKMDFSLKEVLSTDEGKKFNEIFRKFLKKGDNFIDCGANVGRYTILASWIVGGSAKVGNKGHVYSFEPTPSTFKQLLLNIKNSHHTNITPLNCALGEKKGTGLFKVSSVQSGANSFITKYYIKDTKRIQIMRLDDLFKHKNQKINLIKIDVEGYEKNLLLGARELIKSSKPVIIFEFNFTLLYLMDKDYNQVFDLLEGLGYDEFREINTWRRIRSYRDLSAPCTDVIALPHRAP